MRKIALSLIVFCLFSIPSPALDAGLPRAVESWRDLKFGMFIHWGLYSVAGGVWNGEKVETGYSEQIMAWAPASREEYAGLASQFTAEKWDPDAVCGLAKAAGMRYIVLISAGSFDLDTGKACSLTVQAPGYRPGEPAGVSLAGMRILQKPIQDD